MKGPTNTLILTNVLEGVLQNPQPLIEFLSQSNFVIELVSLTKFQRILVICENVLEALDIKRMIEKANSWNGLKISFSMKDNEFGKDMDHFVGGDHVDYLELPLESGSRRFLISPPESPAPGWDQWNKVEEGPNKTSVYSPEELSHLLWERLGGFDSTKVKKYTQPEEVDIYRKPEILFQDIDNGVPAIMLDSVGGEARGAKFGKTMMPPPG